MELIDLCCNVETASPLTHFLKVRTEDSCFQAFCIQLLKIMVKRRICIFDLFWFIVGAIVSKDWSCCLQFYITAHFAAPYWPFYHYNDDDDHHLSEVTNIWFGFWFLLGQWQLQVALTPLQLNEQNVQLFTFLFDPQLQVKKKKKGKSIFKPFLPQ